LEARLGGGALTPSQKLLGHRVGGVLVSATNPMSLTRLFADLNRSLKPAPMPAHRAVISLADALQTARWWGGFCGEPDRYQP
jgi:hypothetical protein